MNKLLFWNSSCVPEHRAPSRSRSLQGNLWPRVNPTWQEAETWPPATSKAAEFGMKNEASGKGEKSHGVLLHSCWWATVTLLVLGQGVKCKHPGPAHWSSLFVPPYTTPKPVTCCPLRLMEIPLASLASLRIGNQDMVSRSLLTGLSSPPVCISELSSGVLSEDTNIVFFF